MAILYMTCMLIKLSVVSTYSFYSFLCVYMYALINFIWTPVLNSQEIEPWALAACFPHPLPPNQAALKAWVPRLEAPDLQ